MPPSPALCVKGIESRILVYEREYLLLGKLEGVFNLGKQQLAV